MQLTFNVLGLDMKAGCTYTEGYTNAIWAIHEPAQLHINDLTVDGKDATFLLDSVLGEAIGEAAYEAMVALNAS